MAEWFYKLSAGIAKRRDLKPSDKLVFAIIADHIGNNNHGWPGIRTISKKAGIAPCTVTESIARLEAAKVLNVERRGSGKSSHYSIAESARKTRMVESQSARKTRTEALGKPEQNQKDCYKESTENASFTFLLKSKSLWHLPQEKLKEYAEAYPRLDVESELCKAAQWLVDNPARRKTARGMTRFLGGWLGRAEPKPQPKRGDPDWYPSAAEVEAALGGTRE